EFSEADLGVLDDALQCLALDDGLHLRRRRKFSRLCQCRQSQENLEIHSRRHSMEAAANENYSITPARDSPKDTGEQIRKLFGSMASDFQGCCSGCGVNPGDANL